MNHFFAYSTRALIAGLSAAALMSSPAAVNAAPSPTADDIAANLAVFGAAVPGILSAHEASAAAIAARQDYESLAKAAKNPGFGLWLTPVLRHSKPSSLRAEELKYGNELEIEGLILGSDYTAENGLRLGAILNLGSGDVDGSGAAAAVNGDFDYLSGALYAGMAFESLSLAGDLTYTRAEHDLKARTSEGAICSEADSEALSLGVMGSYRFTLSYVDVTPYAGLRYTTIKLDDYKVRHARGPVARTEAERLDFVSLPFGITFSREFALNHKWQARPYLDLGGSLSSGDDKLKLKTTFFGEEAQAHSAWARDRHAYHGAAGMSFKYADFVTLGAALVHEGSSHSKESALQGTISFEF